MEALLPSFRKLFLLDCLIISGTFAIIFNLMSIKFLTINVYVQQCKEKSRRFQLLHVELNLKIF